MKPLIAFFVFILALGLTAKSIADIAPTPTPELCTTENTENCSKPTAANHVEATASHGTPAHGAGHESGHNALSTRMNSLFPEKQKDQTHTVMPSVTKISSPKFLEKVSAGTVKLQWAAAANATSYHVQVATDPNFKWLVANENSVQGTSFDAPNLEAGKRYFWRVASVNADNESMFTKSLFVGSSFDTK